MQVPSLGGEDPLEEGMEIFIWGEVREIAAMKLKDTYSLEGKL